MTAIANIFFKNKTIIATDSLGVFNTDQRKLGSHCTKSQHYPHLQCVISTTGAQSLRFLLDQFIHKHSGLTCMDDLQVLLDDTFLPWLQNHPYLASRNIYEDGFLGVIQLHGISAEHKVRANDFFQYNQKNSKRSGPALICISYLVKIDAMTSQIEYDPDIFPFNGIELLRGIDYQLDVHCEHEKTNVNFDKHPVIDPYREKISRNNMSDNIAALIALLSSYHDMSESNNRDTTVVGGQLHFYIIENINGVLVASSFVGHEFPDFSHNIEEILANLENKKTIAH